MAISASKLDEAFPEIDPGVTPLGAKVLVQLRLVRKKTASGIILHEETKEFNRSVGQMAKVIKLGPISYRSRDTGEEWKEGAWVKPGDYVRAIKYGGDRFTRKLGEEDIDFLILNDHEIYAKVDPEAFEELDDIK